MDKVKHANYHAKYFCGGEKFILLIGVIKNVFLTIIQKYVVNW